MDTGIKERKHLNFESLFSYMKETFSKVSDSRQAGKVKYSMEEILSSAFGCFYFQEPSFLQYQLKMQEGTSQSNISSILGVKNIPKEYKEIEIREFQLKFGDMILLGSDGKDNIMVTEEETDETLFHNDPKRYLDLIVNSNTDLLFFKR